MKKFTIALILCITANAAFSQYFTKDSIVPVYRTASDITIDGKVDEKCWDSTMWMPIQYVWEKDGALTTAADIRASKLGIDSSDYSASFKMLWSSKTNMVYILVKVTDNVLISNYNWASAKGDYTKFDDVEIFYQHNDTCRKPWPGGEHTFTHFAKAIHLTSNGYGVDMGGPSWGSFVLYNRSMKSAIDKSKAPIYTWEIGMKLVNSKVKDNQLQSELDYSVDPLPDSLIRTLGENNRFGFIINYIDVDVANQARQAFVSNIYIPNTTNEARTISKPERNAGWVDASVFGLAKLMTYSTKEYLDQKPDTTDTTTLPKSLKNMGDMSVNFYPNPVKETLTVHVASEANENVEISVLNMLGTTVAVKQINNSNGPVKETISMSGQPAGMYMLMVTVGKERVVKKIYKQ